MGHHHHQQQQQQQHLSLEERWSEDRVQECVEAWNLGEEERHELLIFKKHISDIDHWKNCPWEVIRFLKEFKFHMKTAEQKFRHSVQWRKDNSADSILETYCPPKLYQYFPAAVIQGTDHDGDPIYIERSGAADTLGLLHRFGREEMVREAIWVRELMTRGPWIKRRQKPVQYFTVVLDLKGLNRHHMNPSLIPVGQQVTRLIQDNYPGIGKKILVIRAPGLFRFVWNIFKHFVDPHVKELIEIATEKETEALLEKYMDLKVLPPAVCPRYGQGQAERGFDPVWEGGPIPKPSDKDQELMDPVFPSSSSPEQENPKQHRNMPIPSSPAKTTSSSSSHSSLSTSWENLPPIQTQRQPVTHAWSVTPIPLVDRDQVWSDDNFNDMARLWNLSLQDQEKMRELQHRLQDVHHWKNDPYEVVRYFWEYKGKLPLVEDMFRKMIQWRMDYDMESFLERHGEPDPLFHYMPCAMLNTTDKDGDPLWIDRMGSCDYYSLLKHFGAQAMTDHMTFIFEMNGHKHFWQPYERQVGHRFTQFTSIIDMEGLNRNHMRPGLFPLLNRVSRIAQDYYAGDLKRILIIRAPKLFTLIWALVRHFFDPHVRDMIQVAGHADSMRLLDKYVDREALPSVVCPEGRAGVMPGYYENVHLEGGPIPSELFQEHPMRSPRTIHVPMDTATTSATAAVSNSTKPAVLEPLPSHVQASAAEVLLKGCWDDSNDSSLICAWPMAFNLFSRKT